MIKSTVKPMGNPLATDSDRIQLPFPTLRLHWHNGSPQAAKEGVKYFGGWFSSDDKPDFISDLNALGRSEFPTDFVGPETWTSKDGKDYISYSGRAVLAAPIGTRVMWFQKDGKTSSKTEILVYLACRTKEGAIAYAPAVLSAGGYAGNFIVDAFKKFVSDTAKLRAECAPGIGANYFYAAVGTFGKDRPTRLVGKGAQSPIVQCVYAVPGGEWTEASLEKYFVGDEVAAEMNRLHDQALEWLHDKGTDKKADAQERGIEPNIDTEPNFEENPFA
mgnify:CR=1 FL=1